MKDYEMYDNETKVGTTYVFLDNINDRCKNSIIKSCRNIKYELVKKINNIQKYELEYTLNNKDDLYSIVSKYIDDDKNRFKEIDNIKKYNNIKKIKKNQIILIPLPEPYLKKLNVSKDNIDTNSLINAKIYFINKVCENNKLKIIKSKLDKIVNNFKSIINNKNYLIYTDEEKDKIKNKALILLNELVLYVEEKTNYKFGKHFTICLKIKCNK